MGGKKGGPVLGSWIKEFCTLVFIQTIQAFIYAIIISIIVNLNWTNVSGDDATDDANSSMGIICVIALTSVFKVEEMVKKIFGIGNTRADIKGAVSSLAKTALAWNFGKRVLDNGGKIVGGIKAKQDAAKGRQKLKARMERDRATYDINGEMKERSLDAMEQGQGSGFTDMTPGTSASTNGNEPTNSASSGTKRKDGKTIRDYNAMMDKYQDQLDELKKKRQEGTKQILRGLGETVGAIPGAAIGATVGGADGDIDGALRGAAFGMGVGDSIGGAAAESAYTLSSSPKKGYDAFKKLQKAVNEQEIEGKGLEKARNRAVEYYRQATKNRVSERDLQAMIKKANEANADNAN